VNFTRILFTLSFISCIVCFVFGCLAYSNRERRIWYKTLGWILIAISLVTLISLIIFPVGFLKHYPIYVNWFFGVGYGFGWAALCLNVRILDRVWNQISKIEILTQIFRNVKFLFRSWQVFYSFLVMVNETKSVSLQKSAFVSECNSGIYKQYQYRLQ